MNVSEEDYLVFKNWLQCYDNPLMNNMVDHEKRTIWFHVNSLSYQIIACTINLG